MTEAQIRADERARIVALLASEEAHARREGHKITAGVIAAMIELIREDAGKRDP